MPTELSKQPLILVDGSSYLFRAYYALPPLTNASGEPTGAIYGVINMLRRLLKDYDTKHLAVVFDPKGKTFRHKLYPQYKANRTVMPDELQVQIKPLHDMIRAMGLPLVIEEGVEADDVIGTLATEANEAGIPVVISTGDKDMAQLVTDKVTLVNTMTNRTLDEKGVEEKFGCRPDQIIDYLTLVGDTSDNIPGVPSVGPKTAAKWIKQYGSLDKLIQAAGEIKGKVGEKLRDHLDALPLSRELVTIKRDLTLHENVEMLVLQEPDKAKLIEFFSHYGFKNLLAELTENSQEVVPPKAKKAYRMIVQKKELADLVKKIQTHKHYAFDTETTSLDARNAELVGISVAVSDYVAYIPVGHDYASVPAQLAREEVLKAFVPLFHDSSLTMIGQNLKYDLEVLLNYHVEVKNKLIDTMIEAYILQGGGSRNDLDSLAMKYLGHKTITFEEIAGKGAKQKTFNEIELEVATEYACEDAEITLALHQKFSSMLAQEKALQQVFDKIDMPLVNILTCMESFGVLIDVDQLQQQSAELGKRIEALVEKTYAIAGQEFNLGSPKQLQEILYEKLQLPVLKKTPGGQPSTAEPVLQELALDYPLPKIILEYRSLSKLKSTYTDKLPLQVDSATNRVHTSYNQTVTSTGRLSSNNPNLQNIPVRSSEGRKIRKAFIAPNGYRLVAADYSQIELRIIAEVSKDPGLLKAFQDNLDIHRATASEVFGVPLEKVTSEQRRHAKTINFGLLYGMSAFGLAKNLNISREEAKKYMEVYFERYPNVHQYMEDTITFAKEHGYVESLFGRRVFVPEINSKNGIRKKAAERAAINAPMQSSAADIIKLAMLCVQDWLKQSNLEANMIMQVHDELVLEVKAEAVEEVVVQLKQCMENAYKISIPLLVEVGVGANWEEAHA